MLIRKIALVPALAAIAILALLPTATLASPPSVSADQLRRATQLTNIFENSDVENQYDYIEDLDDGRGYTAGRIGFTSADGEIPRIVAAFKLSRPGHPLERYLARLQALADAHDSSVCGLEGLPAAWRDAASDPAMRRIQDDLVRTLVIDPVLDAMTRLGARSGLAFAALHDMLVQHGDGDDPDGMPALLANAARRARGTPAQGVDEGAWLAAVLEVRHEDLLDAHDPETRAVWRESAPRVGVLQRILDARNLALDGPIRVRVFGYDGLIK